MYVGATEVIPEEFETPPDKWKKFFALTGEDGVGGVGYLVSAPSPHSFLFSRRIRPGSIMPLIEHKRV